MNLAHFFITTLFVGDFDTHNDGYQNDHLNLVFMREGNEGIVDIINMLATRVEHDKDYNPDDEANLYDICKKEFDSYLTRHIKRKVI